MNKKLRINFVQGPASRISGGPLALLEYANRLIEYGHIVSITTYPNLYWLGENPYPWFNFKGKIYYKDYRSNKLGWFFIRAYRKLVRVWSRRRKGKDPFSFIAGELPIWRDIIEVMPDCDLNIATFWSTAFPVYFSKKGKPVYFMQHYEEIFYPLDSEHMFERLAVRMSYGLPLFKIANSSWLKKIILEHYGQDIPFSNNGIELADFYPRQKKSEKNGIIRIVTYARPEEWKGFPDAVAAMRKIKEKWGNKVEWHVFGYLHPEFPENNSYAQYVYHPKLSFKELSELYAVSDIALCVSWYESFPLPALEAMASGTAVVTTAYGTEDYAFNNENALVVGSRDITAMVDSINKLIENVTLRDQLAKAGRKTAEKFDWDHAVNAREKILLDIYHNKPGYDVLKSAKFSEKDAFGLEFEEAPKEFEKLKGIYWDDSKLFLLDQGVARHVVQSDLALKLVNMGIEYLNLDQLDICRIPRGQAIISEADLPVI